MSLQAQQPSAQYNANEEALWRRQINLADAANLKRGQDVNGSRLIVRSPDGTQYVLTVANGGALSAVAL